MLLPSEAQTLQPCSAVCRPRRAADDNLWALPPPPTFVDLRAPDAIVACVVILLQFSMTIKRSSENFEERRNFFRESLKKLCWAPTPRRRRFFGPAANRRRRPKLTGGPPPTPQRRDTLLQPCEVAFQSV